MRRFRVRRIGKFPLSTLLHRIHRLVHSGDARVTGETAVDLRRGFHRLSKRAVFPRVASRVGPMRNEKSRAMRMLLTVANERRILLFEGRSDLFGTDTRFAGTRCKDPRRG
jgi:hypothetical protein